MYRLQRHLPRWFELPDGGLEEDERKWRVLRVERCLATRCAAAIRDDTPAFTVAVFSILLSSSRVQKSSHTRCISLTTKFGSELLYIGASTTVICSSSILCIYPHRLLFHHNLHDRLLSIWSELRFRPRPPVLPLPHLSSKPTPLPLLINPPLPLLRLFPTHPPPNLQLFFKPRVRIAHRPSLT